MSKYLKVHDDGSITVKEVVLSYPHLFTPWDKDGNKDKEKYGAVFILDKKKHKDEIEEIRGMLDTRQKAKWKKRIGAAQLCLRDGDQTGKEEYEGKWILASSDKKMAPNLVDRDGKKKITERDDKLYAGAVVNGRVQFWDQDNQHGQRINANLIGVQWMGDGERFSSVTRPNEDETFDNEGGDSGDDGFGDD